MASGSSSIAPPDPAETTGLVVGGVILGLSAATGIGGALILAGSGVATGAGVAGAVMVTFGGVLLVTGIIVLVSAAVGG
jgi:hypothetical protein